MEAPERILENSVPVTESGCWIWLGNCRTDGYGRLRFNNKTYTAHRFSYRAFVGEIPNALHVLHKCDVRGCVNPDHLFLGTNVDNIKDRSAKGRSAKGDRSPQAKLCRSQVLEIRKAYSAGNVTQKDIANAYGVSRSLVSAIVRREVWDHLRWHEQQQKGGGE
jgi:hypothetical protein